LGSIIQHPGHVVPGGWSLSFHTARASGLCLQPALFGSSFPERGPGWGPEWRPKRAAASLCDSGAITTLAKDWYGNICTPSLVAPSCPFVSLMRCAMLSTSTHFVGTGVAGCPPCGVCFPTGRVVLRSSKLRAWNGREPEREEKRLAQHSAYIVLTLPYAHICLIIPFCPLHHFLRITCIGLFAYAAGTCAVLPSRMGRTALLLCVYSLF